MRSLPKHLKLILFLLLYLLVIIYTLALPTTASWFIFYAFTLWIATSFLSTRQSYHLTHARKIKKDDNSFSLFFTIENKHRRPFFLSAIKISLTIDDNRQSYYTPLLFPSLIESQFDSIVLPRGHHDTLTLDVEGMGLFGIWVKRSQLVVPINIDVYPAILTKSERTKLMYTLTPSFTESSRSLNHDYYMNEIRSFQNRDNLAGIDWKTSLKRGQWMVKEYEVEEESPIDLFFIGCDSDSFEILLSIGYTLMHDLKDNQKINLFLLGTFDNTLAIKQTEESFLSIKPTKNRQELIRLSQTVVNKPSKKIIIKPRNFNFSLPLNSHLEHRFIDEDTLLQVKGGQERVFNN